MQKIFEKIDRRIRIATTEACSYTPLTRVISEAELKDIIDDAITEYNDGWIPYDEPPKNDDYVLLSFANVSVPLIGRYEEDREGGAYYLGDEDKTCVSQDIIVTAWKPLPQPYQPDANRPKKTNFDRCCESIEDMAQIIEIAKIGWTKDQIIEWLQKEAEE